MADKSKRWDPRGPNKEQLRADGKFYVDEQCIDCDLCRETAHPFFTRHDEGGYSYVSKQPVSEDDIARCMEALEGCPVEAIGDDGDEVV